MIIFVKNNTMEKTAVEFIVKELIKLGYLHSNDYGQSPNVTKVIEQAKEMERRQIIDAHIDGINCDSKKNGYSIKISENYYKDTFSN